MFAIVEAFVTVRRVLSLTATAALLALGATSGGGARSVPVDAPHDRLASAPHFAAHGLAASCSACHAELRRGEDAQCIDRPRRAAP